MKFLVVDYLFPKGHKSFNNNIVKTLSNIGEIILLSSNGYYNSEDFKDTINNVKIIETEIGVKNNRVSSRIAAIRLMKLTEKIIREFSPDYIIITSFDTISFALSKIISKELSKFYLIHHNNVDGLRQHIKKKIFGLYMNEVNHIVLDEFIRDHLISCIGVCSNKVWSIPHPLNKTKTGYTDKKFLCVGLSNSNDDNLIKQIIIHEETNRYFSKNSKKAVFKSKNHIFDNGFLKVLNGYLDKEKYDYYTLNCKYMYIPFPSSFQNRMSGTLIDALSNNTIVIGSKIPAIQHFNLRYPEICKIVNSTDELFEILSDKSVQIEMKNQQFELFKENHSEMKLTRTFNEIFYGDK